MRPRAILAMRRRFAGLAAAAVLLLAVQPGLAQDPKQTPSNPVGGPFATKVTPDPNAGITLDPKQTELVQLVSGYFNELQNLRGNFVQTTADNKRLRGKFFVKRPGRLRFEYNQPSKLLIVADGQQLAIQDLDLNTDDRLALDQTVFRILLRKDVDLLRDARILDVQEADDLIILSLQDKNPDTSGRIRLFMSKTPALELKEWVTTDAQGEVRVELNTINRAEEIDAGIFKITSPTLKKIQ